MFDPSGETAVVTGGSMGLGSYKAKALAHANLVITARNVADCSDTA